MRRHKRLFASFPSSHSPPFANHVSSAMNKLLFSISLAAAATLTPALLADPMVQTGDRVAFLGDSITQYGASNPAGYVKLVVSGLSINGIAVDPVFAGVSGDRSVDMLGRLEADVLAKKPAFMTLSCGVNDVWKGKDGVSLEAYQANITQIIERAKAAGVRPIILTATMISENPDEETNRQLAPYNEFLRDLAAERNLPLADVNARMQEEVRMARASNAPRWNRNFYLTCDSVHMGPRGDQMMAECVLRTLGLNDDQLSKAKLAWQEIPEAIHVEWKRNITLKEYDALSKKAAAENLSFVDYLNREFDQTVSTLLGK